MTTYVIQLQVFSDDLVCVRSKMYYPSMSITQNATEFVMAHDGESEVRWWIFLAKLDKRLRALSWIFLLSVLWLSLEVVRTVKIYKHIWYIVGPYCILYIHSFPHIVRIRRCRLFDGDDYIDRRTPGEIIVLSSMQWNGSEISTTNA